MKFIRKRLYKLIKEDIELQITKRILAFYDRLVEDGQIKPMPKKEPAEEN